MKSLPTDNLAQEMQRTVKEIISFGPRYLGDPGESLVREFMVRQFRKLGFEPEIEEFDLVGYVGGGASCHVADSDLSAPAVGLQWTAAGEVEAEAVFLGQPSSAEDIRREGQRRDLRGRIVIVDGPWPFITVPALIEFGVAGVINISGAADGYLAHYTAQAYPRPVPRGAGHALPVPGIVIDRKAGMAIVSMLADNPKPKLRISHRAQYCGFRTANIVVRVNGRDSEEHVILTAHTDTQRGTIGAWDNGTGLAALLSLADRWRRRPTSRGAVFVATADEEQGLSGAIEYCMRHRSDLESAVAMLNLDALAWLKGGEIALHVDPALQDYALAKLDETGWRPSAVYETSALPGADHNPFVDAGVPAAWLWRQMPMHPYYHSERDVIDLVDFEATAENAVVIEYLARSLADDPDLALGRSRPYRKWMDI